MSGFPRNSASIRSAPRPVRRIQRDLIVLAASLAVFAV